MALSAQAQEPSRDSSPRPERLPVPKGYKILISLPEVEETSVGGIILAKKTLAAEEAGSMVGLVLQLGPDAYKGVSASGHQKFPSGPYCEVGDYILMRSYSGSRFRVDGKEYRLINDDSVEAVVADPEGIVKV